MKNLYSAKVKISIIYAVPQLRRFVAGFPLQLPRSGHVGFMMDKMV
jgi:hypothetical protein